MNRREILSFGMLAGMGVLRPKDLAHEPKQWVEAICQAGSTDIPRTGSARGDSDLALAPPLAPFVDALTIPPVMEPGGSTADVLEISMRAFQHKAHRDLPACTMWGYEGMWPGPTIEARRGAPCTIQWINKLPTRHLLPIDRTIHGAEDPTPEVRTVVHVHGAQVLPESDGYPDAWVTSDNRTGSHFRPGPSIYPNRQRAATLWYHDHAIGASRMNVYAGLAGLYLLRDQEEDALGLPRGRFEIPLLIQDRTFGADGTLLYPAADGGTHPVWSQEFLGEVACVNGKVHPYLEVEPRRYRLRLVNGSNSRFYHLSLVPTDPKGQPTGTIADAPALTQIGSDAGLLARPLPLHFLVLAPGERIDLVVDFARYEGHQFVFTNDAPAPYTRGGQTVTRHIMQFRVARRLSSPDTSRVPGQLAAISMLDPAEAVRERVLAVTEMDRPSDGYTEIGLLGDRHWSAPITEDPKAGSTEIWTFANTTGDVHPLHVHLVHFQVLNRQAFDVQAYLRTRQIIFTGNPIPPESNERPAWKDTVKCYPGFLTRVIHRFDLPLDTPLQSGQEFLYVWHCHMLEHEDNEMMRPYKVIA